MANPLDKIKAEDYYLDLSQETEPLIKERESAFRRDLVRSGTKLFELMKNSKFDDKINLLKTCKTEKEFVNLIPVFWGEFHRNNHQDKEIIVDGTSFVDRPLYKSKISYKLKNLFITKLLKQLDQEKIDWVAKNAFCFDGLDFNHLKYLASKVSSENKIYLLRNLTVFVQDNNIYGEYKPYSQPQFWEVLKGLLDDLKGKDCFGNIIGFFNSKIISESELFYTMIYLIDKYPETNGKDILENINRLPEGIRKAIYAKGIFAYYMDEVIGILDSNLETTVKSISKNLGINPGDFFKALVQKIVSGNGSIKAFDYTKPLNINIISSN